MTETLGTGVKRHLSPRIQSGFSLQKKKGKETGIKEVPSGICVPFTDEEHGKNNKVRPHAKDVFGFRGQKQPG